MPSFRTTGAALAFLSLVPTVFSDCESFGVDFTSGGTFFQNSNSTDPFTAIQEFTGCQADSAHNVFIDPTGDQTECSETPMTPDNTPQLITCEDWPKDRLYDGDWSILIISNNGDTGEPIAYQRDFSLTVGTQQTSTVTPTVTVSNVETPVVNVTRTAVETITETADASTITSGRGTHTVTPRPTTITQTRGFVTLTQHRQTWDVVPSTTTVEASCSVEPTSHVKDPIASVVPYVLGDLNHIAEDIINFNRGILGGIFGNIFNFGRKTRTGRFGAGFHFKREIVEGRTPSEELKKAFVAERAANLKRNSLNKRAPDERTKTVTDDTPVTSTQLITGAATTQTITSTQQSTVTSTPPPVTAAPVTVTAQQSTRTKQVNLPIVITTETRTYTTTIVNTATTTASGAAESCASRGGVLLD